MLLEYKLFEPAFYSTDVPDRGTAYPHCFKLGVRVRNGGLEPAARVSFMLDQCHTIEAEIPAVIRSVMNVQEATAKALTVDTGTGHGPRRQETAAPVRPGPGPRPAGRAPRQMPCFLRIASMSEKSSLGAADRG